MELAFTGAAFAFSILAIALAAFVSYIHFNTVEKRLYRLDSELIGMVSELNKLNAKLAEEQAVRLKIVARLSDVEHAMTAEPGAYLPQRDPTTGETKYVRSQQLEDLWQSQGAPMSAGPHPLDLVRSMMNG